MAQWAVYAIRRADRRHTAMAIGLVFLFGVGALNLQIVVYRELEVGLTSSPFATLFYGVTGAFMIALLVGSRLRRRHRVPVARRSLRGHGHRRRGGVRALLALPDGGVLRRLARRVREQVGRRC